METSDKSSHLQKYYLKLICRILYYFGLGDCWYENTERTKIHKCLYTIWAIISNAYVIIILLNEYLANFRTDLTDKEKNDLLQFDFAHTSIYAKIVTFYVYKEDIKSLLKRFLEETRHVFSCIEVDKASVRHFVRYSITLVCVSYVTLLSASIDAYRTHVNEGIPIRTEVTYFPMRNDTGFSINVFRFFIEFHWYYIVGIMVTIDCLTVCCLVFLGYKFKLLRVFYGNIREKMETPGDRRRDVEFKNDFIVGIKLHEDALWCARNIQKTLGVFYGIQIFECVTLLVMCLIKVAASAERHMVYLLANFVYIACLIVLTGSYMLPAGDITHEASLLSTSIFHCGWELTNCKTDLRVLTVIALQRSQTPVIMTAFGILALSYTNLISVLRSSYSFFAVIY